MKLNKKIDILLVKISKKRIYYCTIYSKKEIINDINQSFIKNRFYNIKISFVYFIIVFYFDKFIALKFK